MRPETAFTLANLILFVHAIVVGLTVAGTVALFTGRFREPGRADVFFWLFMLACFGQIASLVFTGGCFLTEWERELRLLANAKDDYAATFLENYLPFLSPSLIRAVPLLTAAAMIGAVVQLLLAARRWRTNKPAESRAAEAGGSSRAATE